MGTLITVRVSVQRPKRQTQVWPLFHFLPHVVQDCRSHKAHSHVVLSSLQRDKQRASPQMTVEFNTAYYRHNDQTASCRKYYLFLMSESGIKEEGERQNDMTEIKETSYTEQNQNEHDY